MKPRRSFNGSVICIFFPAQIFNYDHAQILVAVSDIKYMSMLSEVVHVFEISVMTYIPVPQTINDRFLTDTNNHSLTSQFTPENDRVFGLLYASYGQSIAYMGILKLGRMHRQTGEKFVDPTAMSRQMREVSDF